MTFLGSLTVSRKRETLGFWGVGGGFFLFGFGFFFGRERHCEFGLVGFLLVWVLGGFEWPTPKGELQNKLFTFLATNTWQLQKMTMTLLLCSSV